METHQILPSDRLFMRTTQVADLENTIRTNEAKLSNPNIQNKPAVMKQTRLLRKQLQDQRAPELDADSRDAVAKRLKHLEDDIRVGMPSHEEMRKNPNGAVGAHQRWEKANKRKVIQWKNGQVALNPGNDDPELSSVERLRPTTSHLSMAGAQIPGKIFSLPSEQFQENYDKIDFEEKKPAVAARPARPGKKPYSENARAAASARMKALHEKKRAEKAAALAAEQGEQSVAS